MSLRFTINPLTAGILLWMWGCGGSSSDEQPSKAPQEAPQEAPFSLLVAEEPIVLEAPETLLVQLVVIGAGDQPVSFSAQQLPSFVTLSGSHLMLSPKYGDAGDHELVLEAAAGDKTSSATLRLHITRKNTYAYWLPSPDLKTEGGGTSFYHFPSVRGTPVIQTYICDKEGDDVTLEIEDFPKDQEHSGPHVATYRETRHTQFLWPREACALFEMPLTGLPLNVTQRIFLHTYDALGAEFPYGWVDFGGLTVVP